MLINYFLFLLERNVEAFNQCYVMSDAMSLSVVYSLKLHFQFTYEVWFGAGYEKKTTFKLYNIRNFFWFKRYKALLEMECNSVCCKK